MHPISVLIVLTFVISSALSLDITLNQRWNLWKNTHNKRYSDAEEHVRRTIWESNLHKVQQHNFEADLGLHTYWLGMNKYADLTNKEFVKRMNGFSASVQQETRQHGHTYVFNPNLGALPDTVDWREKGFVTPVRDQSQCSSDWAFAATGAVEGQHFNATGKLIPLSIQELVDCSDKQGNQGCVNGTANNAFQYIKDNGGMEAEDSYPYECIDYKCRSNTTKNVVTVTGFVNVASKDENALQQAVANIGPIAVAIDSSHSSFQLYKSGIYHQLFCSEIHLDRAMLVVGYGAESSTDFWIVKNSWGTGWGEQGYIRMTRNKRNECGIATMASYPTV